MSKWFNKMDCYILAGGENNPQKDFSREGELTRLEKSFQSYAKIFDKVKVVIKEKQAKEKYLNYPHVTDQSSEQKPLVGVAAALDHSEKEAVFIGSSEIKDFPPTLLYNLIKNYDGESFMGYTKGDSTQPLFGIYHKRLFDRIDESSLEQMTVEDLIPEDAKLLELPEKYDENCIGLS